MRTYSIDDYPDPGSPAERLRYFSDMAYGAAGPAPLPCRPSFKMHRDGGPDYDGLAVPDPETASVAVPFLPKSAPQAAPDPGAEYRQFLACLATAGNRHAASVLEAL